MTPNQPTAPQPAPPEVCPECAARRRSVFGAADATCKKHRVSPAPEQKPHPFEHSDGWKCSVCGKSALDSTHDYAPAVAPQPAGADTSQSEWPERITIIRYEDGGFSATINMPPDGAKFARVYAPVSDNSKEK